MRIIISLAAICLTSGPCLAGGEPSPPYYPAPAPMYAPPAYVPPLPNPIAILGAGLGGLVIGVIGLPSAVLGGIAHPPVPSCVYDGVLAPCPPGMPAYPPPYYEPGYGGQDPSPLEPWDRQHHQELSYPPPAHPRGGSCYGPDGGWTGDGNLECAN